MAHENIKWTETLPAVLLGLRVAVKPDINASSAELVYGVSLRLPAEICTDTSSMPLDYGFVQQLKNHMNHLKPLSTSTHGFSKFLCTLNWMTVLMCSSVLTKVKPAFVFKDLPDTIPDPIISAESSHRHPVTTNMQTTKSGRRTLALKSQAQHLKDITSVSFLSHGSLETLLDLGASPNYKDSKGLTPLYYTLLHASDHQLTEILLHDHAFIGTCDPQGWQEVHQVFIFF
ncbi:SH3 and multiple ankyrin repeat domains protein 3 [Trichonephila clavipes]|uniref:SH3 and multiple ankyrin repeat domains protein 3 n=1 Tax=Trichonephila clavipes TaxID=2585209 RepID=A0A8X6VN92_TRICX|nr:SH3 and multiple ankyrin repeat domains protein 3 [Trichonephila clavipes]